MSKNFLKNLFFVDELHVKSNMIAGVFVVTSLAVLYFFKPFGDAYASQLIILMALVVGGVVYTIAEFIRKLRSL